MQVEPESSEGESDGEHEGVDGAAATDAYPPSIVTGAAYCNGGEAGTDVDLWHCRSMGKGMGPKGAVNVQLVDQKPLGEQPSSHREKDGTSNLRPGCFASQEACHEVHSYAALSLTPKRRELLPEAAAAVKSESKNSVDGGTFGLKGEG
jgi:hypothetical protein